MKNFTFVHFGKELFIPESGRMTDSDFFWHLSNIAILIKFVYFTLKGKTRIVNTHCFCAGLFKPLWLPSCLQRC